VLLTVLVLLLDSTVLRAVCLVRLLRATRTLFSRITEIDIVLLNLIFIAALSRTVFLLPIRISFILRAGENRGHDLHPRLRRSCDPALRRAGQKSHDHSKLA